MTDGACIPDGCGELIRQLVLGFERVEIAERVMDIGRRSIDFEALPCAAPPICNGKPLGICAGLEGRIGGEA